MFYQNYNEDIISLIDNIFNSSEYNKDTLFKTKNNTKYTVNKDKENNTVIYIPASGLNKEDIEINANSKNLYIKSLKKEKDVIPYTNSIDIAFKLDKFDYKDIGVELLNGILCIKLKKSKNEDETIKINF